jgi:hypothetical protein
MFAGQITDSRTTPLLATFLLVEISVEHSSQDAEVDLIHLTDRDHWELITQELILHGGRGIFAVSNAIADRHWLIKVIRTGLPPSRTAHYIEIPKATVNEFARPICWGPYSGWKHFGGIYFAPAGEINLQSGTFQETPR